MTFTTTQKLALYEIGGKGRKEASTLAYQLSSAMKAIGDQDASGEMLDLATMLTFEITDTEYEGIYEAVYKEVDAYYRCMDCNSHHHCPFIEGLGGANESE